MIAESSPRRIASQRWDVVDVVRGLAICAMVVYHFSWDLSFYKLIATNIVQEPAWRWFARSIAGTFLTLTGMGLALAHARGFRRVPFLRRFVKIAGAAALITIATYLAFPDSYIFFGILHAIAVFSVLALPFLHLPPVAALGGGALCLAAPRLLTQSWWDQPWLDWLGLGATDPVTNDYVPVFPWFGLVLFGVALGKVMVARQETLSLARWRAQAAPARFLTVAGRRSLPIYLLHQPVLLAILYGVLRLTGPNPVAEARPFMDQCEANCVQINGDPRACRATCSCVVDGLRRDGVWRDVMADDVDQAKQTRISRIAQQCLRGTTPPSPG